MPAARVPMDVAAAISSAQCTIRPHGAEGYERVLVGMPGIGMFLFTAEGATAALKKHFPGINDDEAIAGARMLGQVIQTQLRQAEDRHARQARRNWVSNW